jgi:hypothetical protein
MNFRSCTEVSPFEEIGDQMLINRCQAYECIDQQERRGQACRFRGFGTVGKEFGKDKHWMSELHGGMSFLLSRNYTDKQPERIKGESTGQASSYTASSDVWSVGLSIVELAKGCYPYPPETFANVFAQLTAIVHGPAPTLPSGYSQDAHDFVAKW